ncbi:hypothetical protein GCM10023322_02520 [Rugosimonospora acidiphila]|uniref:Peptidase S8/S53 domain-containing protein n=1 Tax=Rugosimonospora acidiphila TaxID=556531 RepID=A0ABP9RHJ7_9ACTN
MDLVAPGGDVVAAGPGRTLASYDATSFAAPFVSATAALIRQHDPGLPAVRVSERILASADPAPDGRRSSGYGHGVANPLRAVTESLASSGPAAAPARVRMAPRPVAAPDRTRDRAAALALAGTGLAALVLLAAVVIRRGSRRGWRAGPG